MLPNNDVSNVGLSIGISNITQETVDNAVSSIEHECSKIFESMIPTIKGKSYDSPSETTYFHELQGLSKQHINGRLHIKYPAKTIESGEKLYSLFVEGRISCIDDSTRLGALVSQLNKRVLQLGFLCDAFDLRFEKGRLHSMAPNWHYDPSIVCQTAVQAIFINFSNKDNWYTRISAATKKDNGESLSEPAKFGYIYDPTVILHRSPIQKDLKEDLTQDDYRLFIRLHKSSKSD